MYGYDILWDKQVWIVVVVNRASASHFFILSKVAKCSLPLTGSRVEEGTPLASPPS